MDQKLKRWQTKLIKLLREHIKSYKEYKECAERAKNFELALRYEEKINALGNFLSDAKNKQLIKE